MDLYIFLLTVLLFTFPRSDATPAVHPVDAARVGVVPAAGVHAHQQEHRDGDRGEEVSLPHHYHQPLNVQHT